MRTIFKEESCYNSLVFTEKTFANSNREFEKSIQMNLEGKLGNSVHVEYVYNVGPKINNIDYCLNYIDHHFGTLDNSSTLGIKTKKWKDQKTLIISWKNKNWLKNRITTA